MKLESGGQIASWYHSKILRIPHGKQNPTKKYLNTEQVIEGFTGEVEIQEKVDGKLDCTQMQLDAPNQKHFWLSELLTQKHSPHDHVIKYKTNTNRVWLDTVFVGYDGIPEINPMLFGSPLKYGTVRLINPTIEQIHLILGAFAKLESHFGSPVIEGLVCKNYKKQIMMKWINEEFEDKIKESEKKNP